MKKNLNTLFKYRKRVVIQPMTNLIATLFSYGFVSPNTHSSGIVQERLDAVREE